jgi:hypothetical protein
VKGEVSSINSDGAQQWRVRTRSSWLRDGAVDFIPNVLFNSKIISELAGHWKKQPTDVI